MTIRYYGDLSNNYCRIFTIAPNIALDRAENEPSKICVLNNYGYFLFVPDLHHDVLQSHEGGAREDRGPDPPG